MKNYSRKGRPVAVTPAEELEKKLPIRLERETLGRLAVIAIEAAKVHKTLLAELIRGLHMIGRKLPKGVMRQINI